MTLMSWIRCPKKSRAETTPSLTMSDLLLARDVSIELSILKDPRTELDRSVNASLSLIALADG